MNIQELVADLQTKCMWVGQPFKKPNSANAPLPESWAIHVIEIGAGGTYSSVKDFTFTVLNKGVVAGPQTIWQEQTDANGDPVLDAEGMPVMEEVPALDEDGNQIVIPPQAAETILAQQQVLTPVGDTFTAVGYLEAQRAAGTWLRYVENDEGPKRPDLGFFAIKAFVEQPDGSVTEKKYLIAKDAQGQPFHTEIV